MLLASIGLDVQGTHPHPEEGRGFVLIRSLYS
jgi:hypothetical protein